jgi:hypothetical protein
MNILKIYMCRLAILAVLFALSIGMVAVANGEANVSSKTSSNVGTNMTSSISISSVNYATADLWVEIANNGSSNVNFTGWKLMNKENITYAFPTSFVLKPGAQVKVHSNAGKPNSTDLYNSSVLWSRTGDTAILKDASGKVVSKYSYPVVSPRTPEVITSAVKPNVTSTKGSENKATNAITTTSSVTTNTSKDITKITIVK